MQITANLHHAVAQHPGAVAPVCGGRRHTFAQVADRVARFAGALRRLGVQPRATVSTSWPPIPTATSKPAWRCPGPAR